MKRLKWIERKPWYHTAENDHVLCTVNMHKIQGKEKWRGDVRFFMRLYGSPYDEWRAKLRIPRSTANAAKRACGRLARRIVNGDLSHE